MFFPDHDPWFTAILLRGYLDLYALDKNDEYINTVIKNVNYAWQNARNENGFFYEDSNDRQGMECCRRMCERRPPALL